MCFSFLVMQERQRAKTSLLLISFSIDDILFSRLCEGGELLDRILAR